MLTITAMNIIVVNDLQRGDQLFSATGFYSFFAPLESAVRLRAGVFSGRESAVEWSMCMETINWGNPPVGLYNFPLDLWAERGEFTARGLRLDPNTHLTGQEYATNIQRGIYDMGHIGTPVFLPAALGSDEYAVISIGVCDYAPFYFIADPSIDHLADCKGAAFVINKYKTCPHSLLKWHARQYDLTEHDFDVIELMAGSQFENYGMAFVDGIQNNGFRAGILYEPYVSMIEREFGWRVLGDYPQIARPANYAFLLYARRSWIAQKPALVAKVLTAYFDCVASGRDNVEALAGYAEKFSFIQPEDVRNAIVREARHWRLRPGLDERFLQRIEDELLEQQLVPNDYRIQDYVVTLAAHAAQANPDIVQKKMNRLD